MQFEQIIEDVVLTDTPQGERQVRLARYKNRYFEISGEMYRLIRYAQQGISDDVQLAAIFSRETNKTLAHEEIATIKSKFAQQLSKESAEALDTIRFKLKLMGPALVQRLTGYLTFLYQPWLMVSAIALSLTMLVYVLIGFKGENIFLMAINRFHPTTLIIASVIFTFITLFHELGHATACRKYGLAQGNIGFGIYFFTPVFYNDSTHAWQLNNKQRLLIDVGGIYFQVLALIPVCYLYIFHGSDVAAYLILVNLSTILTNLNPLLKYDGYWILADLLNIPNMRRKTGQITSRFILQYVFFKKLKEDKALSQISRGKKRTLMVYTLASSLLFGMFFFYFIPKFIWMLGQSIYQKAGELISAGSSGNLGAFLMQNGAGLFHLLLSILIGLFLAKTLLMFLVSIYRFLRLHIFKSNPSA